jgi:hypothetical protein
MELKVVEHEYRGRKTGSHRLEIIPSGAGHFLVRDKNAAERRSNKVGVFNALQTDMEAVANGDNSLSDYLQPGSDSFTAKPRGSVELVAETYVGSNTWSPVVSIVEVAPVPVQLD